MFIIGRNMLQLQFFANYLIFWAHDNQFCFHRMFVRMLPFTVPEKLEVVVMFSLIVTPIVAACLILMPEA